MHMCAMCLKKFIRDIIGQEARFISFGCLLGYIFNIWHHIRFWLYYGEQSMEKLLARAAVAPWIPNKFLLGLASMSVQTLSKLQQLRPYGVSEIGNIDTVSSQQMYEKTCFRIDVDNLYGTNFKQ